MKNILILLAICFLGNNTLFSQGTVIYKNSFAGAAGSSPAATTPEINTIAGFTHWANEAITLDGNGNIIWDGEATPNFGSYSFRLDPTPLNQNPALTGIKATVVLRTSTRWVATAFGNYATAINPTAANANTWFITTATNFQIFGGEGSAQGGGVGGVAHADNDTITVEYIYYFDQTVTLISNGDTIVNRLSKPHTQGGAEADPSILWCMLTIQKVTGFIDDVSKRPFISELTIETLGSEMTTRYIDLSVDQTGWEDCITSVRNDFSEQQIKVFPNPSDGVFEMNVAGFSFGQSLTLQVVDSQGRIIQTREERLGVDGQHNFQIDLSGQSAGIYYIVLMDRTNKVYNCKIIKN